MDNGVIGKSTHIKLFLNCLMSDGIDTPVSSQPYNLCKIDNSILHDVFTI